MFRTASRLVLALVISGAGSAPAAPATEVEAIHAADDAWNKAHNAGDVDGVVALYDEHAVLMPPGAPAVIGRSAIRAYYAKDMAESTNAGITISQGANPDGGASGDWGWASGTYTVKDKDGRVLDTGKYLSVSKKVTGRWLYVRDTWNSDGPAAAPPVSTGN